jgi:hypothetical protein
MVKFPKRRELKEDEEASSAAGAVIVWAGLLLRLALEGCRGFARLPLLAFQGCFKAAHGACPAGKWSCGDRSANLSTPP